MFVNCDEVIAPTYEFSTVGKLIHLAVCHRKDSPVDIIVIPEAMSLNVCVNYC